MVELQMAPRGIQWSEVRGKNEEILSSEKLRFLFKTIVAFKD